LQKKILSYFITNFCFILDECGIGPEHWSWTIWSYSNDISNHRCV